MEIQRAWFEQLIFRGAAAQRFTQDSPVLPDVWIRYAETYPVRGGPTELILTPHRDASSAELAHAVRERLKAARRSAATKVAKNKPDIRDARIAYHLSGVAADLSFEELIRVVMPLSAWWQETFQGALSELLSPSARKLLVKELKRLSSDSPSDEAKQEPVSQLTMTPDLLWTIRIVGSILLARRPPKVGSSKAFDALTRRHENLVAAFAKLMADVIPVKEEEKKPLLWTVSRNRKVKLAIARSRQAVKADAAQRLFDIDTRNLAWAILDTGIDAEHPAFQRRVKAGVGRRSPVVSGLANSRIVATFDFTHIRDLLNPDLDERPSAVSDQPQGEEQDSEDREERAKELTRRLQRGATIDWDGLRPFLEVPHDSRYGQKRPTSEHGTHVAGILAGHWERDETVGKPGPPESLVGMCPDLNLYDFRVFDQNGSGDEFMVMAALQFIRHLNSQREQAAIQGVNLSLSLIHDVANYACGRTPICDECERVVNSGVIVVAAAGNEGYMRFITPQGDSEGYRSISISDPGNAEGVITVGATHRYQPHTFGVSYFSSRGPTGDGRQKPDLVAPGEKITAPIPGARWGTKDGTSMAAPHVSGAAALLIARHRELLGRPQRVKEILCSTATDLGRERYFQGSGMVDVLRALQSV
jgi:serine protease AprX